MNLNFLKSLIECDLIFSKNKAGFSVTLTDPILLNKEIKQFIRLVQSLDKSSQTLLYLWVENKYTLGILNAFLKKDNVCLDLLIKTTLPSISDEKNLKALISVLDIGSNRKKINRAFINHRFFLITSLTSGEKKVNPGDYNVTLDLKDLNRLTFFIVLIRSLIQK